MASKKERKVWYLIRPVTSYRTVVPTTAVGPRVRPWRGQEEWAREVANSRGEKESGKLLKHIKIPLERHSRSRCQSDGDELTANNNKTSVETTIESLLNFLVHFCDLWEVQELTHCQNSSLLLPTHHTAAYEATLHDSIIAEITVTTASMKCWDGNRKIEKNWQLGNKKVCLFSTCEWADFGADKPPPRAIKTPVIN